MWDQIYAWIIAKIIWFHQHVNTGIRKAHDPIYFCTVLGTSWETDLQKLEKYLAWPTSQNKYSGVWPLKYWLGWVGPRTFQHLKLLLKSPVTIGQVLTLFYLNQWPNFQNLKFMVSAEKLYFLFPTFQFIHFVRYFNSWNYVSFKNNTWCFTG